MARPREGWKLRMPRRPGESITVRFTLQTGHPREVSTGTRDPVQAAAEAARIYAAEAIAGPIAERGRIDPTLELDKLMALWLADLEKTHDVETVKTYIGYSKRFLAFFGKSLSGVTVARMGDYQRDRLTKVLKSSLGKERSSLNVFFEWCVEQGVLGREHVPIWPELSKRTKGTRSGKQRSAPVDITPEQAMAFVLALPIESLRTRRGRKFPVRARFVFAAETGLRPATIDAIETPKHWRRGSAELFVSADIDKARAERRVPLTGPAIAALEAALLLRGGGDGPIFGRHDYRTAVEAARVAAGLPKGFAPYDLRHHFLSFMTDQTETRAVMHLGGHKRLTTTDRYVRGAPDRAREAMAALGSRGVLGEEVPMLSAKEGSRTPTRVTPLEPESRSIGEVSDTYSRVEGHDAPLTPTEGPGYWGPPETIERAHKFLAALRAEWDVYDEIDAAEGEDVFEPLRRTTCP